MIKYCQEQWDKNKDKLQTYFKNSEDLQECEYIDLLKAVVKYILNIDSYFEWDSSKITLIDDGDYQGTFLFLIPRDTYQPQEYEYLTTFIYYGSCTGCDVLLDIQFDSDYNTKKLTSQQVEDYMVLCLHMIQRMKLFYPAPDWLSQKENFEEIEEIKEFDEIKLV